MGRGHLHAIVRRLIQGRPGARRMSGMSARGTTQEDTGARYWKNSYVGGTPTHRRQRAASEMRAPGEAGDSTQRLVAVGRVQGGESRGADPFSADS